MEHHSEGSVSSDTHKRKKCCNRHTSNQIQRLEAVFKTCSYPDEKQRLQLGRELAMDPTKIKFWFQNRRTQLKTQNERDDNCTLIQENDKIRSQNKAMREALQNVICSTCDGQKLRIENARLKEELVRVSSIAAGYTGSSSTLPNVPYQPAGLSHKEKSLMFDIATNAMQELIFLMETNEPLWMKSNNNGRDTLNLETYETMFPRTNNQLKNPNIRIEASRKSGDVIMNALTLVEMFMDPIDFVEQHKWMELFPTIVTIAKTIEVISSRTKDGLDGSLQLMYEELQVLSPLVPIREFYFLRYCKQFEEGWAIVDVSYEFPHNKHFASKFRGHRLPSGCFIQNMPNGKSKVTWIEHVEVEDRNPVHMLYRNVIYSGVAFGAEKWLTTLQIMCERIASYLMDSVIPSPDGKRTMMKLTQRMVTNFCESINGSASHRWTTLSTLNEIM
ncbi:putative transcription factor & lipid binding HD-SAD family [Medicago truncatula]|uniref:Putative transcription factor & lipid binding HD-SAD family n=1 Tax=Medicago truncatula TaxID=3880 RepID=A0A396H1A6_MEDTR|nr:putative transcription factor & lipid binding HD-SAD family [Medicago truncatula]